MHDSILSRNCIEPCATSEFGTVTTPNTDAMISKTKNNAKKVVVRIGPAQDTREVKVTQTTSSARYSTAQTDQHGAGEPKQAALARQVFGNGHESAEVVDCGDAVTVDDLPGSSRPWLAAADEIGRKGGRVDEDHAPRQPP